MIESVLELIVPILLAALGGLLTERAGVLNIGLEGLVLVGAFFGVSVAGATGSWLLGLVAGMAAGSMLALLHSIVCIELRANIFVSGLAVNILAASLIPYVSGVLHDTRGVVRLDPSVVLPEVAGVSVMVVVSVLVAAAAWVMLFRTPLGVRLRATGSNPEAVRSRGMRPSGLQRLAIVASGALAGLGGADIGLRLGVYLPNISAGRGWIALVAIYLGARDPLGLIAAAALFAAVEYLAGAAQGFSAIPGTVLTGAPYLITMIAMVVYAVIRRTSRRPD